MTRFQALLTKLKSPEILLTLLFCGLYIFTAPFTVQSGDTGELVTNSLFLRVAHPPGYPLWTLLYHVPIKYFPALSPFHAAAIFTVLISGIWLGILFTRFKNKESFALISVLGTSLIFWRYSVLPDVFSLHMFFLVMVFISFLNSELLDKKWIIFIISLCVANHHTILFAFPMYIYALTKGDKKKKCLYSLIFGLLSGSLYFLLFFFHPEDYGSWGQISNFQDVVKHFFRADYGTFKLQSNEVKGESAWFLFFLRSLGSQSWSLILAIIYVGFTQYRQLKAYMPQVLILFFCIFIYFLTFAFGGVMALDVLGETIFERFLMQPILLLFFAGLILINIPGIKLPQWLVLAFMVNAGLNLVSNFRVNNYGKNTVIEDFAINSFQVLPEKSVFLTQGDTPGNSAYYVHEVLKVRPDVIHIHPNFGFQWSIKKIHKKYPQIFSNSNPHILESINYDKFSFFMNTPPTHLPEYFGVKYFGVIFNIYKSTKDRTDIQYLCDVSEKYKWRHRSSLDDFEMFENSRIYELEYGRCDYIRGWNAFSSGDKVLGRKLLERAVELSEQSVKYWERLCFVYKEMQDSRLSMCEEKLSEILALSNQQYYNYTYGN